MTKFGLLSRARLGHCLDMNCAGDTLGSLTCFPLRAIYGLTAYDPTDNLYSYKNDETLIEAEKKIQLDQALDFFGKSYDYIVINRNGAVFLGQTSDALAFRDSTLHELPNPKYPFYADPPGIAVFYAPVYLQFSKLKWRYIKETQFDNIVQDGVNWILRKKFPSLSDNWDATQALLVTWYGLAYDGCFKASECKQTNEFQLLLLWKRGAESFAIVNYNQLNWSQIGPRVAQFGFNLGNGEGFVQMPTTSLMELQNVSLTDRPGQYVYQINRDQVRQGGCRLESTIEDASCTPATKPTTISAFPEKLHQFGGQFLHLFGGPCITEPKRYLCLFEKVLLNGEDPKPFVYVSSMKNEPDLGCLTPTLMKDGYYSVTIAQDIGGQRRPACFSGRTYRTYVEFVPGIIGLDNDNQNSDAIPRIFIVNEEETLYPAKAGASQNLTLKIELNKLPANTPNFVLSVHSLPLLRPIATSQQLQLRPRAESNELLFHLSREFTCTDQINACRDSEFGILSLTNEATKEKIWSPVIPIQWKDKSQQHRIVQKAENSTREEESKLRREKLENCKSSKARNYQFGWQLDTKTVTCPCTLNQAIADVASFYPTKNCPLTRSRRCSSKQQCFLGSSTNRSWKKEVIVLCCYNKHTKSLIFPNDPQSGERDETRLEIQPSMAINVLHATEFGEIASNRNAAKNFWDAYLMPYRQCCLDSEASHQRNVNCEAFWVNDPFKVTCSDYIPPQTGFLFGNSHVVQPRWFSEMKGTCASFTAPSHNGNECPHKVGDMLVNDVGSTFSLSREFGDFRMTTNPDLQLRLSDSRITQKITGSEITAIAWGTPNTGVHCQALLGNKNLEARCAGIKLDPITKSPLALTATASLACILNEKVALVPNNVSPLHIAQGNVLTVRVSMATNESLFDYKSMQEYSTVNEAPYQLLIEESELKVPSDMECKQNQFCTKDWQISESADSLKMISKLSEVLREGSERVLTCDWPVLNGVDVAYSAENRNLGTRIEFLGCESPNTNRFILDTLTNRGKNVWFPNNFTKEESVIICNMDEPTNTVSWLPHGRIERWQKVCQTQLGYSALGSLTYWTITAAVGIVLVILLTVICVIVKFRTPERRSKGSRMSANNGPVHVDGPALYSTKSMSNVPIGLVSNPYGTIIKTGKRAPVEFVGYRTTRPCEPLLREGTLYTQSGRRLSFHLPEPDEDSISQTARLCPIVSSATWVNANGPATRIRLASTSNSSQGNGFRPISRPAYSPFVAVEADSNCTIESDINMQGQVITSTSYNPFAPGTSPYIPLIMDPNTGYARPSPQPYSGPSFAVLDSSGFSPDESSYSPTMDKQVRFTGDMSVQQPTLSISAIGDTYTSLEEVTRGFIEPPYATAGGLETFSRKLPIPKPLEKLPISISDRQTPDGKTDDHADYATVVRSRNKNIQSINGAYENNSSSPGTSEQEASSQPSSNQTMEVRSLSSFENGQRCPPIGLNGFPESHSFLSC
ncbi:hypothetical protein Ciccas_000547 [Cichlidogyrus casuarinus]|uniref:AMOP domain-containing protein n=1 Tax=Cichlidogyrus casuarinus TaxID=1844966 RepID=A0ABD2QMK7_9PLAT